MNSITSGKSFRVFIADDDADDRDFIQSALLAIDKGIDTIYTHDGVDLMERLHLRLNESEHLPHLILLDLLMIRKTGIEVLQELKLNEQLASIPVLILSGSADPRMIREAFANGARGYILKPMTKSAWQVLMKEILESFKPGEGESAPAQPRLFGLPLHL